MGSDKNNARTCLNIRKNALNYKNIKPLKEHKKKDSWKIGADKNGRK